MRKLINKYKNLSTPLKATMWFTICNIFQKGILFLAVPVYTRIMSTEQYGIYSVILSWLDIFEIVATFRLGWGGYVVGLTKYSSDRSAYTSSLQCLSVLITTVTLGIYLLFSDPINSLTGLNTTITVLIFGCMYFVPAVQFWSVRKRVEYKYMSFVFLTVAASAMMLLLGTVFAMASESKAQAVLGARFLVLLVEGLPLIWLNCKDDFTFFHKAYWKRTLKFNVPLLPYYLSTVLLNSSDKIVIKMLVGASEAGIYGVAYSASRCMQIFSTSINQTLQPWMFDKMKKDDTSEVPSVINLTLLLMGALNLLLIALAPEAITLIAPKQYTEAIWVIPPLAASMFVMYFYQHFVNIEFYFEDSKMTAAASIGAAVLNLALNFLLIPRFGYLAAGYTTLFSYLFFALAHYIFMRRLCKKRNYTARLVDIRTMMIILIAFMVLAAVMMVGYRIPVIRYLLLLVLLLVCVVKRKQLAVLLQKFKK